MGTVDVDAGGAAAASLGEPLLLPSAASATADSNSGSGGGGGGALAGDDVHVRDGRHRIQDQQQQQQKGQQQAADPAVLAARAAHYGPNAALSYARPLHIVRGAGCRLYDSDGDEYLDCVNNVAHLGHCHPGVVAAVSAQLAQLNTNSRYLHTALNDYAAELTATLPEPLKVSQHLLRR